MYKSIIWDFDGTLFDTYPVMGKILQELLSEAGFEESVDDVIRLMKISIPQALSYYEEKHSIESNFLEVLKEKQNTIETSLYQPFDGIEEICNLISASGKKNYLYTHRGESALFYLKRFDLYSLFSDFITFENGFERKPSPNAINYLVEEHGLVRSQSLMIGDRELDVMAGKNAGIDGCLFCEEKVIESAADHIIKSIKELHPIIF